MGRAPLTVLAAVLGCTPAKRDLPEPTDSATDTGEPRFPGTEELVRPDAWALLDEADDPFPSHRPDPVDCSEDGWHEEDGLLEIETNLCNYLNLVQPTQADVEDGDTIELLVFHSALSSTDAPAEAHIAVLLDGEPVMDEIIPIPSSSEIYDHTGLPWVAVPAGAPVVLHLHNHGGNAWKLAHLRRVRD